MSTVNERLLRVAAAGVRSWVAWFCAIAVVAGLAMCWVIPPVGGTDERAHVLRLATIDDGWLIPPLNEVDAADYTVSGCVTTFVIFGRSALRSGSETCGDRAMARCLEPLDVGCSKDSPIKAILAAEPYPPVVYAPAWVGYRVGSLVADPEVPFRWSRVSQLLVYVALGALAIRIAPWGKPFLFGVALLPVVVQTASTVSADALTNGVALVATAFTLELVDRGRSGRSPASGRRLVAFGAAFVLLGMTKPGYAVVALAVMAVPTAAFGSLRRRATTVAAILGLVAATNVLWIVGVADRLDQAPRAGTDPVAQAEWVSSHPLAFVESVGRTWSDSEEFTFIVKGAVAPVSRVDMDMDIAWWTWAATMLGLIGAYVLDTTPGFARFRWSRGSAPSTIAAVGVGPDPDRDPDPDPGGGSDEPAEPAGGTAPFSSRVDWWAASVVATIGVALVMVVTYAMALAANPVAPAVVAGVQGRYFLPLLPLCLLVSRTPRKQVWVTQALWLPIGCALLLGWWTTVLSRL